MCHHGGPVGGHYTCYRQHDRYHRAEEDEEEEEETGLEAGKDGEAHTAGEKEKEEVEERKEEGREERKEEKREEAVGEERKEARTDRVASAAPFVPHLNSVDRVWVHVSDDEVRRVSWREVANCEAYMLFYEKEICR